MKINIYYILKEGELMEANLLTLANDYQNQREWEKAIECYEQYIEENANCTETTYVSYAKCLRFVGLTNQAKNILLEANKIYPQSEQVLVELLNLYDHLGDWKATKSITNTLLEISPKNSNYYFKLGRAYSYLRNKKGAKQAYKAGLMYRHGMSIKELIKKVQSGFIGQSDEMIMSKYVFMGGRNNLGAIHHEYRNKKYITKISRSNKGTQREGIFYKEICSQFPILKKIAPLYVDLQTIDNIQYLTIEKIDDIKKKKSIEKVIEISQLISTVNYQDIIKNHPNLNYPLTLKSRTNYITIFFTQIHKKHYNQQLFSALRKFAHQNKYPEHTVQIIQQLEKLIMGNQLYTFIKPEKHYSLLHGDFAPSNMKIKKDDNALKVFDWATFKTGPHFIDIARYFVISSTSYSDIKELYLFNEQLDRKMDLIERIFFLYAFILFHFIILKNKKKILDKTVSELILPALLDLEVHISIFTRKEPVLTPFSMQLLLDNNKLIRLESRELKKKVKKLERENLNLRKENNKTKTKLQNVLNSKSWKFTAPLRKLMERKKN